MKRFSSYVLVSIAIMYNFMDIIVISIFATKLPRLLNETDSNLSWIQPGTIISFIYLPSLVLCIPIGILATKLSSEFVFCLGLLWHGFGALVLSLGTGHAHLICGGVLDGVGAALGAVSFMDIIRRTFSCDSTRQRTMNCCALGRIVGYGFTFYIGTVAYECLGNAVVFGFVSGLDFLLSFIVFVTAKHLKQLDHNVEVTESDNCLEKTIEGTSKTLEKKAGQIGCMDIIRTPRACLIYIQILVIHWSGAVMYSTGPQYLQLEVGLSAVENGQVLGIALSITFLFLIFMLTFIHTNTRRTIVMVLLVLQIVFALCAYPFVTSFAFALFSEICNQCSKNCINPMIATVLMVISEKNGLDFRGVNSVYIAIRYGCQFVGVFAAPFLVSGLGFRVTYLSLGCVALPVAVSMFTYLQLDKDIGK